MGKAALIAVAAFAAMSTLYASTNQRGLLRASERAANFQYETLARSAAVNGFNLAKQSLAEAFVSKEFEGRFDRAAYGVSISVSGDRAQVEAIGQIPNASSEESRYRIYGEFQRRLAPPTPAEEAPEFMSFALMAEDDLRISGNSGTASAHTGGRMNANFRTNGDLTVDGTGTRYVSGYGFYAGKAKGKHRETKFFPPVDEGGNHTQEVDEIPIPKFDVSEYLARVAADEQTSGSTSLTGTFSPGGTRDNPFIWHVSGDLDLGDVTIDGYVVFLVEGDITFNGNATVGSSGYAEKDESSVAFYSGEDIELKGTSQVWGQLFAEEDIELGGTADLYGSLTAGGEVNIYGDPEIHYREASAALTTIWNGEPGGTRIRMTSLFEK